MSRPFINSRGVFVPSRLALGAQSQYEPIFNPSLPAPLSSYCVNSRNRSRLASLQFSEGMRRLNARRQRTRRGFRGRSNARPTIPRSLYRARDTQIEKLTTTSGVYSANVSGVINNIETFSMTTAPSWTPLAELFDEWKLIACEVTPIWINAQAGVNLTLAACYDPDDNSVALTNIASAVSYRSYKLFQVNSTAAVTPTFRVKIRNMPNSTTWETTGSTVFPGSIKFYGSGFISSAAVLNLIVIYTVIFRTRRNT